MRIPGWVNNNPVPSDLYDYIHPDSTSYYLKVNSKVFDAKVEDGYAVIDRVWKKNDKVDFDLPMSIHRVKANEKVAADRGLVALEREPVLYCVEDKDNAFDINNLILPDTSDLKLVFEKNVLNLSIFTQSNENQI